MARWRTFRGNGSTATSPRPQPKPSKLNHAGARPRLHAGASARDPGLRAADAVHGKRGDGLRACAGLAACRGTGDPGAGAGLAGDAVHQLLPRHAASGPAFPVLLRAAAGPVVPRPDQWCDGRDHGPDAAFLGLHGRGDPRRDHRSRPQPVGGGAIDRHDPGADDAAHRASAGGPDRGADAGQLLHRHDQGHVAGLHTGGDRDDGCHAEGGCGQLSLLRCARGRRHLVLDHRREDEPGAEAARNISQQGLCAMISIRGLTKRFGGTTVLDAIDLDIADGERVVVIGPSGTGKSTLLRCVNFLDRPDAGTIAVGDVVVDAERASKRDMLALRRATAFVFQNYALFANKTAKENIMEALVTVQRRPKDEAERRALAVLAETGLAEKADSYPSALSGGQQQRVGIGRAMAIGADLMLFDEPTSALDPEWVGEVLDLMRRVAEQRQTMLIVTHEMQFAREIADRVVFMDGGRIVEAGPPDQVLDTPKDERLRRFLRRVA